MNGDNRTRTRPIGPLGFFAWSVLVGVVSALGAVAFRTMIAVFHNLLFLGEWSLTYDANVHTSPGPWGPWVILVPVLGAIGVAFLITTFAPEARGHGVPEVMEAIYYHKGAIRPVVAVIKSLASALSIGSGGAVGREGPIAQIGSSFGSTLGQVLKVPVWQRITLIAAGAGAGIAATFNTPIGGVLFAVELMLPEVSHRTLIPVTIATATASYLGRLCLGSNPSFIIPPLEAHYFLETRPILLVLYLGLGGLMGLVSILCIRSIYAFEDVFEKRIRTNYYFRHMLGMLVVGIVMYVLLRTTGHYHVEGVGYATVQDVLSGQVSWLLLVLFALKLLVTSLTLGSGASGGIFSPALYLGATMGGAYGLLLHQIFPGLPIHPVAFAVAGMAGVVGGATGASLTAVVMIFEMTLDYSIIIPMIVTVAFSYAVRKMLHGQSIYTEKLSRRGHHIPQALQATVHQVLATRDVMDTRFIALPADGTLDDIVSIAATRPEISCFLIDGPEGFVGYLTRDAALRLAEHPENAVPLTELADRRFVTVSEATPVRNVMAHLQDAAGSVVIVTDGAEKLSGVNIRGLITKRQIADAVMAGRDLFSE